MRCYRLIAAVAVAVVLLSGLCLAVDFKADMVTKLGKMTIPGKLYVSGGNWRQEATIDGRPQIVLARGNTVYTISPELKQYMVRRSSDKPWSASAMVRVLSKGMNVKSCGKQTINGVTCDKLVYTHKDKKPGSITQYMSKELDLSMRVLMTSPKGNATLEFMNVRKGSSPASLFQVPKGYKKVTAMTPPGGRK